MGSFPCRFGKEFPAFLLHLKRRRSPPERREGLKGRATIPRVPEMTRSIPGKPVFPALPRLSSRGSNHTTVARGTALWESLVGNPCGKPRGKATDSLIHAKGSVTSCYSSGGKQTCMPALATRTDSPAESSKYAKIHVSTGEEYAVFGTDSTQGLRPRDRRERNPERPPCNSHGDWPFMRAPEWVPEIPVVCREHLQQLEKIQEVLPSRRNEAHFR